MKTKFLVSLVMFLMCVGLQGVSLAENLILNPSFENGTTGWNGLSVTDMDSTNGDYSGLSDVSGFLLVSQGTAGNPSIPVQKNTDYVLSFDARRIEEGWDGTELAVMINYGVSQTVIDIEGEVTPSWPALDYRLENGWYPSLVWYTYNTDWHHIKVEFNSGNFNNVYIGFRVKLGSLTQNILLDNFRLSALPPPVLINRVLNPSFENGTTNWNGLSGVTDVDSTDGAHSGIVGTSGFVTQGTAGNPSIPVQPNTDYVLSFDARSNGDWTTLEVMISYGQSQSPIGINGTISPAVNGYVINGQKFNGWWPEAICDFYGIPGWRHITATFNSGNYDRIYISLYARLDAGESILLDNFSLPELVAAATAPVADAGPDKTVGTGVGATTCSASVTLDGRGSYDTVGDPLISYVWTGPFGTVTGAKPTVTLPVGINTITLTVSDDKGGTDSDEVVINVIDTTPPDIDWTDIGLVITGDGKAKLWPPDHRLVDLTATDTCDTAPLITATVGVSDEMTKGAGGLEHDPDIIYYADDPSVVSIRAERSGRDSDGRVYTIVATDASGNSTTLTVTVPHDQGRKK